MNAQQAGEIVTVMRAASASRVEQDTLDYFETRLLQLDYRPALAAASTGAMAWRRFPSWADFSELYRAETRGKDVDDQRRMREPPPVEKGRKIPFWVRRWIAARFLFARFGRERDYRRFVEQDRFVDSTSEVMPDEAWLEEAEKVSDKDVWGTLSNSPFV